MNFLLPAALGSVIILSVGALIVLVFTSALTRNTAVLATIGVADRCRRIAEASGPHCHS